MRGTWLKLFPVLGSALIAACGGELDDASDEQVDELSDTTYSLEMARKTPGLAPAAELSGLRHVNGRGKPASMTNERDAEAGKWGRNASWLYDAAGLAQFLDLKDPKEHKDDIGVATYARKPGDLYADDGKFTWLDVEQGSLGDCYFAAALASVLQANPGLATDLITERVKDGKVVSYYVKFFQASGRKVRVEVDPDLLHRNGSGGVFYMRSVQTKPGYEEWAPSLVEKAYAKWHKSYNAIGNGGYASDVIYALTGKSTRSYTAKSSSLPDAFAKGAREHKAMTACTWGDKDGVNYDGTGVHSEHCYTVRGVRKSGSKTFIQLRNPWGPGEDTEPVTDGVQDGLFELTLADFQKLFADADIQR